MSERVIFENKNVSYETFLDDLASFLAPKIALMIKNPPKEFYSQRESMKVFGVGNVRRWIKEVNGKATKVDRITSNATVATDALGRWQQSLAVNGFHKKN